MKRQRRETSGLNKQRSSKRKVEKKKHFLSADPIQTPICLVGLTKKGIRLANCKDADNCS